MLNVFTVTISIIFDKGRCLVRLLIAMLLCVKELESLKSELEESMDTTQAATAMRQSREQELMALKKSVEEESTAHEAAMSQLRHKHAQLVEDLNEQLETAKKVLLIIKISTTNIAFLVF